MSKYVSLSELRDLTGKAHRTIVTSLSTLTPKLKGSGKFYDSSAALSLIYAPKVVQEGLDLNAEKARLTSAQANKAELDLEQRSGRLVEADEVVREFSSVITAFRARILAVPVKASPRIAAMEDPDPVKIQQVIRKLIYETLEEFSQYPDVGSRGGSEQGDAPAGAPAGADGESVVRSISSAKSRGKRGTRKVGDKPG